jgi:hypothetical protein
MKVFGREPALVLAFIATVLQLASALGLPLSTAQQGLLNATIAAAFGLFTAAAVARERLVPALVGFVVAVFAVLTGFGFEISDVTQTAVVSVLTAGAAMFVRTQVTAPVPAEGRSLNSV